MNPQTKKNLPEWINWVNQNQFTLKLTTENLAFLIAIKNWNPPDEDSYLNEDNLHSIYDIVDSVFDGLDETKKQRANSAIKTLIEQRVLNSLSSGTADIESTYNLTSLGESICKFFEADDSVSQEALSVMFFNIQMILLEIQKAANLGGDKSHWQLKVKQPLQNTIRELIDSIDRRQRLLDDEQQQTQYQIAELLNKHWAEAISNCEQLLETTSNRLRELQDVLVRACESMQEILTTISNKAEEAGKIDIQRLASQLQTKLDKISRWSEIRLKKWGEFYARVHEFIRNLINIDKDRSFVDRLTESLRTYLDSPWCLICADSEPTQVLREQQPPNAYERTSVQVSDNVEEEYIDPFEEIHEEIKQFVAHHLANEGYLNFVDALLVFLERYSVTEIYQIAGLLIDEMLEQGIPPSPQELIQISWIAVGGDIEVESLKVTAQM